MAVLLAALLPAWGAAGQTQAQADTKTAAATAVRREKTKRQDKKDDAAAVKLSAMETSAVDGVKGDEDLSAGQRKAKLSDIKVDFKAERAAVKKVKTRRQAQEAQDDAGAAAKAAVQKVEIREAKEAGEAAKAASERVAR